MNKKKATRRMIKRSVQTEGDKETGSEDCEIDCKSPTLTASAV
jgi:hypothetical protein